MPFQEIKFRDLIFDTKVQTYCVSSNFKCPSYGHSWACPPVAPYLEQKVSQYIHFYLIFTKFDLKNYIKEEKVKYPHDSEEKIRNEFFLRSILRDNLEQEMCLIIDKFKNSYKENFILWDGFCRVCFNKKDKGCNYDSGNPCRYPKKKRYSMEAVGIDVTRTVLNLNLPIEWPPINHAYRFGLVCFK